jgi:hypothetical protein
LDDLLAFQFLAWPPYSISTTDKTPINWKWTYFQYFNSLTLSFQLTSHHFGLYDFYFLVFPFCFCLFPIFLNHISFKLEHVSNSVVIFSIFCRMYSWLPLETGDGKSGEMVLLITQIYSNSNKRKTFTTVSLLGDTYGKLAFIHL